jgi:hypothetical protein
MKPSRGWLSRSRTPPRHSGQRSVAGKSAPTVAPFEQHTRSDPGGKWHPDCFPTRPMRPGLLDFAVFRETSGDQIMPQTLETPFGIGDGLAMHGGIGAVIDEARPAPDRREAVGAQNRALASSKSNGIGVGVLVPPGPEIERQQQPTLSGYRTLPPTSESRMPTSPSVARTRLASASVLVNAAASR